MIIAELKKDARIKLTGSYGKSILIYLLYFFFSFITSSFSIFIKTKLLSFIYLIAITVLTVSFSFGVIASIMKITRNEDVSITDFAKIGLKNIKGVLRTSGRTLLKLLLPIILLSISFLFLFILFIQGLSNNSISFLENIPIFDITTSNFILAFVLIIASSIFTIYKSFSYSLSYFILFDNPNFTGNEVTEKSKNLMKKNKLNLFLLNLSFIFWYFAIYLIGVILTYIIGDISALVTTFLSLVLLPYITATTIGFYEDLLSTSENTVNE